MSRSSTPWTIEDHPTALQDAIDLELWTIPLYLTALFSIKDLSSEAARLIFSVAAQEMLHLQLACNLANVFGGTPRFNQPVYDPTKGIPFHTPEQGTPVNGPFEVRLGPLDENAINLFLEVELPKELSADHGQGTLGPADTYDSIGEFYAAIQSGITQLWPTHAQPGRRQKNVFQSQYPQINFNITTLNLALQSLELIVDQGEGADPEGHIPTEYVPTGNPTDETSHYVRFLKVKADLLQGGIETYQDTGASATKQQDDLNERFTVFLQDLTASFNSDGSQVNLCNMQPIEPATIAVWQAGACPQFRVLS
ncbi:MAG TPA: ferritin-like protein [Ardenticatenaceae bacterium]|nr:ferritin-like protein [Ardenticatenaceae bacterium]